MKNKFLLLAITILILSINSFAQNHVIGERFGGGIIFYVDSSGQHGLIADSSFQKDANWMDAINECKALRDGGYTDWRLPTRGELNALNAQLSLFKNFWGGFNWSSNDQDSERAWAKELLSETWVAFRKTDKYVVSAVRNF